MRPFIAGLAMLAAVLTGGTVQPAAASTDSGYAVALEQPRGQLEVDINVNDGDTAWWEHPIWFAAAGIGLLFLVLIIVMAARGGGTTVIKE